MRIATRLFLSEGLVVVLTAAIAVIFLTFEAWRIQAMDVAMSFHRITGQIAALTMLADEYQARHEPRIERQWELEISRIRKEMDVLPEAGMVRRIEQSLDALNRAFAELKEDTRARRGAGERGGSARDSERFSLAEGAIGAWARLEGEKSMSAIAEMAQSSLRMQAEERARAMVVLLILIGLLLSVSLSTTFTTVRRTSRGISALVEGATAFEAGDLDHRVRVTGSDEIAMLADRFNAMAKAIAHSLQRERDNAASLEREVLDRKRSQELLRRSEARFSRLLDASGAVVFRQDANLVYTDIHNPVVLPAERMIGRKDEDLFAPEDAAVLTALKRRVIETGVGVRDEVRMAVGGESRWYGVLIEPERDASGKVIGIDGTSTDVTLRRRHEEALRNQSHVLENIGQGVNYTDSNGVIRYTNRAFDVMFGFGRGEAIGKHISTLNDLPPEENARFVEELIGTLNTWGVWSGEFRSRRRDGSSFISRGVVTRLPIAGEVCWMCVQEDITQRKRAERRLQVLLEENTRLSRKLIDVQEEDRAQLARELHDETSQHLAAIRARANAMARSSRSEALRKNAAAIEESARTMYEVSHRLMERLHPHLLDQATLAEALRELALEWSRHNPKVDVRIRIRILPGADAAGEVSRIKLYRILQECLGNVAQHAKARRVRVFLGTVERLEETRLRLVVRDDGVGMDPKAHHAGLGLIGMRERVLAQGGRFEIASTPGRGVRILAEIPL